MEIKMNTKKRMYKKPMLSIKGKVKNLTLAGGSFSSDAPAGGPGSDGPFGG